MTIAAALLRSKFAVSPGKAIMSRRAASSAELVKTILEGGPPKLLYVEPVIKSAPSLRGFWNYPPAIKPPAIFFSFEDRKKQFQKMVDILDKLIDNQRCSTEKMRL